MSSALPAYLPISVCAKHTGIPGPMVRRWFDKGEIRGLRNGTRGQVRINVESLLARAALDEVVNEAPATTRRQTPNEIARQWDKRKGGSE